MPSYEIVGAHFRPPAKGLLAGLEQGTKLHLIAEPTNRFDINAIQVILFSKDILETSWPNLEEELNKFGKERNDILAQNSWHLGYIRKEIAKVLRETNAIQTEKYYPGTYLVSFSGKPIIEV